MIGKLKGVIDDISDDHVTLDVHGVGYDVFPPLRTLAELPGSGEAIVFYIETIVREDFIKLYGFVSQNERAWFRTLTTVQGVGAKVALAMLSTLKTSELSRAIAAQDKAMIGRTPGVGPKLAARIVQELKDKSPLDVGQINLKGAGAPVPEQDNDNLRDAVSALVNLGYAPMHASEVTARLLSKGAANDTATLIRKALKELSQR